MNSLKSLAKLTGGVFLMLNVVIIALCIMFPVNVTMAKIIKLEISLFTLISCFVVGMYLLHNEMKG